MQRGDVSPPQAAKQRPAPRFNTASVETPIRLRSVPNEPGPASHPPKKLTLVVDGITCGGASSSTRIVQATTCKPCLSGWSAVEELTTRHLGFGVSSLLVRELNPGAWKLFWPRAGLS